MRASAFSPYERARVTYFSASLRTDFSSAVSSSTPLKCPESMGPTLTNTYCLKRGPNSRCTFSSTWMPVPLYFSTSSTAVGSDGSSGCGATGASPNDSVVKISSIFSTFCCTCR